MDEIQPDLPEKHIPTQFSLLDNEIKFNIDLSKTELEIYQGHSYRAGTFEGDQKLYAKLRKISINSALTYLSESKQISAEDLYKFLADRRHEIAIILGQKSNPSDSTDFGNIRKLPGDDLYTMLSRQGYYNDNLNKLTCHFERYLQESSSHYIDASTYNSKDKKISDGILIKVNNIALSKINRRVGTQDKFIINHPLAIALPEIFKEINFLYSEIFDAEHQNPKILLKKIAIITWYLAHAVPCFRGSASTTEIVYLYFIIKIWL